VKIPDQPFHFENRDEWRAWLQENHTNQNEAWLVILKNHAAKQGVFYEEAVEEAVCFGWIDGIMKSATTDSYWLRFSPRKRGSIWSLSNQKRVEQLIAQGKMTEAGMEKVKEAKENGEWEAAIRREDLSHLPEDLQGALEMNAEAQANFDHFSESQKKQCLFWVSSAKTAKTRLKRIQELVEMSAKNKRLGEK